MNRELKFRVWYRDKMIVRSLNDLVLESPPHYMFGDRQVMQFTGLKDKNGTDIYEGDIVRRYGKHLSVVAWNEHFCGFTPLCEYRNDYGKPDAEENSQVTEVIGNIYEHPELIGVEK